MMHTAQTNASREIRVFISSTFRDMHAERDYLVSHVFPVIRRACLYLDDFDEPGECYLNSFKKWMLVTVDTEEDIAAILNCMGCFLFIEYISYATAEQFLLQSLAIFEKTLGPNNIMTNGGWYHLAMLRKAQGNYAEAELVFRKVIAVDEMEAISADQEHTILHLCGLANLLSIVDKATEAETLFRRAIKLGNDDSAVNGLANLLNHQGNYVEAELLHRRVLLNRKALLGFKHLPEFVVTLCCCSSWFVL